MLITWVVGNAVCYDYKLGIAKCDDVTLSDGHNIDHGECERHSHS